MSEQKRSVRDEPWAANAPDYMVAAIDLLVETRDEARQLLTKLNEREADLRNQAQVLEEQKQAFGKSLVDMREFANSLYGPDSELTKINLRLADLPRVDEVIRQLIDHKQRLGDLESRVTNLEQRKTA